MKFLPCVPIRLTVSLENYMLKLNEFTAQSSIFCYVAHSLNFIIYIIFPQILMD